MFAALLPTMFIQFTTLHYQKRDLVPDAPFLSSSAMVNLKFNLTQSIDYRVLGGKLPHKIVNLMFTITSENNKLTVLWGESTF